MRNSVTTVQLSYAAVDLASDTPKLQVARCVALMQQSKSFADDFRCGLIEATLDFLLH